MTHVPGFDDHLDNNGNPGIDAATLDMLAEDLPPAPKVATVRGADRRHIVFELEPGNRFHDDTFPYWYAVDLGSVLQFCSRGVEVDRDAARAIGAALIEWADRGAS